jgi:hypothetical protein
MKSGSMTPKQAALAMRAAFFRPEGFNPGNQRLLKRQNEYLQARGFEPARPARALAGQGVQALVQIAFHASGGPRGASATGWPCVRQARHQCHPFSGLPAALGPAQVGVLAQVSA